MLPASAVQSFAPHGSNQGTSNHQLRPPQQIMAIGSNQNAQIAMSTHQSQLSTAASSAQREQAMAQAHGQSDQKTSLLERNQQNTNFLSSAHPGAAIFSKPQLSYSQLLKQEYNGLNLQSQPLTDGADNTSAYLKKLGQNQQSNQPLETLKHNLQTATSEIVRKVLARSDCMQQLRQAIDIKARRIKNKNYDVGTFQSILDKESQRVTLENTTLMKQNIKIEDKRLVKMLQKNVKKMLKPFKGLQYDDFLHNEIHLNQIMQNEKEQSKESIKESRKRHLRILDAALKEQVVDIQVVLGICVQISRQAFYNEFLEYVICAHECIVAQLGTPNCVFTNKDVNQILEIKRKINNMKPHQKVQIQTNKKLDKMFVLLQEQNAEVLKQINNYRNKYAKQAAIQAEESKSYLDALACQGEKGNCHHLNHRSSARSPVAALSASKAHGNIGIGAGIAASNANAGIKTRQSLSGLRSSQGSVQPNNQSSTQQIQNNRGNTNDGSGRKGFGRLNDLSSSNVNTNVSPNQGSQRMGKYSRSGENMLEPTTRVKGKLYTPITKFEGDQEQPNAGKASRTTANKKSKKIKDLTSASDTDGGQIDSRAKQKRAIKAIHRQNDTSTDHSQSTENMMSMMSGAKKKNTQLEPIKPIHTPSASKGHTSAGGVEDFVIPNFRRTEQSFKVNLQRGGIAQHTPLKRNIKQLDPITGSSNKKLNQIGGYLQPPAHTPEISDFDRNTSNFDSNTKYESKRIKLHKRNNTRNAKNGVEISAISQSQVQTASGRKNIVIQMCTCEKKSSKPPTPRKRQPSLDPSKIIIPTVNLEEKNLNSSQDNPMEMVKRESYPEKPQTPSSSFKMKIVTKQRIPSAVPTNRTQNISQTKLSNESFHIDDVDNEDQIVQHEICHTCGGRKPLNSSTTNFINYGEKKTGHLADEFRDSSDGDGPNRDDSSLELNSRGGSSLDFDAFLNTPYLETLGVSEEVQQWVVHNRASKIQWVYLDRLHKRNVEARKIQIYWRRYARIRDMKEYRLKLLDNTLKKTAVRRISYAYRQMKVNKVYNAQQIMQQKGILVPQLYSDYHATAAIIIQRAFRAMFVNRYRLGRKINNDRLARRKMWGSVVKKYQGLQNLDSEFLTVETVFKHERRNYEEFFNKQQINYTKDLNMRANKASQRAKDDFDEKDWTFDTQGRTWTHAKGGFHRLERNDPSTKGVLLEKIMTQAIKNKLPPEKKIQACLDDLAGSKNALQSLLYSEKTFKIEEIRSRIKQERTRNLVDKVFTL